MSIRNISINRRELILSGLTILSSIGMAKYVGAYHRPDHEDISIGIILPQTGPLGVQSKEFLDGAKLACNLINESHTFNLPIGRRESGAPGIRGTKITLLEGDSSADPGKAATQVERLVEKDEVVAFIGGDYAGPTLAASEIAERRKRPFISARSRFIRPTERGFQWFFNLPPSDLQVSDMTMQFLKANRLDNIAIAYERSAYGNLLLSQYKKGVQQLGKNVVSEVDFFQGQGDFVAIKKRNADLWIIVANNPRALIQNATEFQFFPKVTIVATELEVDPVILAAIGGLEKVFFVKYFNQDLSEKKQILKDVTNEFQKRHGRKLTTMSALGFLAMIVVADAVRRAGIRDQWKGYEAVRKALLATEMQAEQVVLPWKGIRFDQKTHQNIEAHPIVIQILDKKAVTVWPSHLALRSPLLDFKK